MKIWEWLEGGRWPVNHPQRWPTPPLGWLTHRPGLIEGHPHRLKVACGPPLTCFEVACGSGIGSHATPSHGDHANPSFFNFFLSTSGPIH